MADVAAGLAERGGRTGSALWRWRPLAYLADALAAEGDRRILWLPVFFATGVTTVVATIGTEPFAIYHFHHLVLYSPLANVIAVPISAMWTLPWGVIACLLMPFGLEKLALVPMGWGIDVTIAVAQWVAALPGNVWSMPRLPTGGMVAVALGGAWLCLWQQKWRWWGTLAIVAGMATMLFTRPPD